MSTALGDYQDAAHSHPRVYFYLTYLDCQSMSRTFVAVEIGFLRGTPLGNGFSMAETTHFLCDEPLADRKCFRVPRE